MLTKYISENQLILCWDTFWDNSWDKNKTAVAFSTTDVLFG